MKSLKILSFVLLVLAWSHISLATSTYLDLIDANNNGAVTFTATTTSYSNSNYYFSILSPDHSTCYLSQLITPVKIITGALTPSKISNTVTILPGLYDLALTDSSLTNTWYLSNGDSSVNTYYNNSLFSNTWNNAPIINNLYSQNDKLALAPIPTTIWLFAGGLALLVFMAWKKNREATSVTIN